MSKYLTINLIAIVFAIHSVECFAQKTAKQIVPFYGDIDAYVKACADSISIFYKKKGIAPSFLFNRNFDLQPIYWASPHSPNSLRYLVLQKVYDLELLDKLSYLKDRRMFLLPDTDSPLPFRKYSFNALIIYRLSELRQKKNYSKFKTQ